MRHSLYSSLTGIMLGLASCTEVPSTEPKEVYGQISGEFSDQRPDSVIYEFSIGTGEEKKDFTCSGVSLEVVRKLDEILTPNDTITLEIPFDKSGELTSGLLTDCLGYLVKVRGVEYNRGIPIQQNPDQP